MRYISAFILVVMFALPLVTGCQLLNVEIQQTVRQIDEESPNKCQRGTELQSSERVQEKSPASSKLKVITDIDNSEHGENK